LDVSSFPSNDKSMTLVHLLESMLHEAEKEYGPRDQSWVVLGIAFEGPVPHLWFPKPGKRIIIKLSESAQNDLVRTYYQLAHECIHLLSPSGSYVVPVIEEGLATVYSERYIARELNFHYETPEPAYANAAALVRELLRTSPDAIAKLRSVEPAFTRLTEKTFVEAGVAAPIPLVKKLLSTFKND